MQLALDTSPLLAREPCRFERRDAFEWLAELPAECADLVVTDPPYESLERHRNMGTTPRLQQWFPVISNDLLPGLMSELYRILRLDSHCYVFVDHETMLHVIPAAEAAGFHFWKPLVWNKVHRGMGYHYAAQYELILFFEKGHRPLNTRSYTDVFSYPRVRGGYPTEKPAELVAILISNSSNAGDIVTDPFLGSGVTAAQAVALGRRFIGCDLLQEACEATRRKIRQTLRELR